MGARLATTLHVAAGDEANAFATVCAGVRDAEILVSVDLGGLSIMAADPDPTVLGTLLRALADIADNKVATWQVQQAGEGTDA